MKKKLSILLVTVLMICGLFSVTAFADQYSVYLGSVNSGDSVNCIISSNTEYAESASLAAYGSVPDGCQIKIAENGKLVLAGMVQGHGEFVFTVTVSDGEREDTYECGLDVAQRQPQLPSVTIMQSVSSCFVGDSAQLAISASVSDAGALSYQWYLNNQEISGETSSTLSVDTSAATTSYYYCRVSNTLNGLTVSTDSSSIAVTISEPTLESIQVATQPTITKYKVGDTLNTEGLSIRAVFAGGTAKSITEGFNASPTLFTSAGNKSIVVSYMGKTCTFNVTVEEQKDERKLSVITMPTKTTYDVNDWLNTSGMRLRVTDGDKTTDISTGFTCSPQTLKKVGTQEITVAYDGLTCTFNVNVKAADQKDKLTIKTMPVKTEYTVGDSLDISGLTLIKESSSTSTVVSSGFTVEPKELTREGIQTVTVKLGEVSTTFTVTVRAAADQTPAPDANAETEETKTPADAAAVDTLKKKGNHALLAFIIIVSLLALAALAAYIYISKIENFEESAVGRFLKDLNDKLERKKK